MQDSNDCSINIYATKVFCFLFLFEVELPKPQATLVWSLPMKSSKLLADTLVDTFATQADLVHHITYTDCQTKKCQLLQTYFMTFKFRFVTKQTINQLKNCCESIIYSIPISKACDKSLFEIQFNLCKDSNCPPYFHQQYWFQKRNLFIHRQVAHCA